ncbi:MAG: DUF2783 domain-containing protein [Roseobacter sp.]
MSLRDMPNFEDADGFYNALLEAHKGLSDVESRDFNARLILVLANHIGDQRTLEEALSVTAAATNP